jgi:hypothetical protein
MSVTKINGISDLTSCINGAGDAFGALILAYVGVNPFISLTTPVPDMLRLICILLIYITDTQRDVTRKGCHCRSGIHHQLFQKRIQEDTKMQR